VTVHFFPPKWPGGEARRRRYLCTVTELLLVLALAWPGHARVIGEENRSRLSDANQRLFAGVGKLICVDRRSRIRGTSTATLVGNRRTVLAVGHFRRIFVDGTLTVLPLGRCRFDLFAPDRRRIFSSPLASVSAARPPEAYGRTGTGTADWAVIRLARAVPERIPPIRLRVATYDRLAALTGVFMVAYHDSPNIPDNEKVHAPDCAPRPVGSRVFAHRCDTSPGASGGLLFVETSRGPRAIGMNNADGVTEDDNFGQLFTDDLMAALPRDAVDPR